MSAKIATGLAEKLAWAMAAAHAQNIIHRDLKPSNILLTANGEPKITDFGVAKNLDRDEGNTRTGSILGTPNYMPPEQAFGESKNLTPQADVYALGAILYEMLTGRPPFKGASPLETIEQLRMQEVVPPRALVGRVPEELQSICLKCLAKEPTARYTSSAQLAEDLRRFQAGEPLQVQPPGTLEKTLKWVKTHTCWTIAFALFTATYIAAVIGAVNYWLLK